MASAFIAIVLVLLLSHQLPDLHRLRQFGWLRQWQQQVGQRSAVPELIVVLGVPVLLCVIVQWLLRGHGLGLPGFVFAAAILFYCIGPRDLERDVEAVDKAPDKDSRTAAAQALRLDDAAAPLPFEAEPLVEAAFDSSLRRVFGVVFWFALLGPAGALIYRLAQLLAYAPDHARALTAEQQALAKQCAGVLDWAPAHLIALALAVASDFDAVHQTWRDFHAAHGKGYFCLDLGFLNAIARASVDADVAAGDGHAIDLHSPLVALDDAMTLIRRVAMVWLVLLALLVIAGWIA